MLNNIKINAGLYTEKAGTGRYINVVLAAGEIEARIRMSNGETFQTTLISGMSFEVPRGFVAVAFTSDVSQQTKVWLSDLPLTYAPSESKVVGSSGLVSSSEKVFFGEPRTMLPAATARGKITMSADDDFYIGGVGVSRSNAIKVPANTLFSVATQGEIQGYTESPLYAPAYSAKFDENSVIDENIVMTGVNMSGGAAPFQGVGGSGVSDKVFILGAGVQSIELDGTYNVQNVTDKVPNGSIAISLNNHYYSLRAQSTGLYLVDVDMSDSTVNETLIFTDNAAIQSYHSFAFDGVRIFAQIYGSANGTQALYGDINGLAVTTIPAGMSVVDSLFAANGELLLRGTTSTTISTDGGATFAPVKPIGYTVSSSSRMVVDVVTGEIYQPADNLLLKTINNGATWVEAFSFGSTYKAAYVVDGLAVIITSAAITVNDGTEKVYPFSENKLNLKSAIINNIGELMAFDLNALHSITGKKIAAGGLNVSIMAEVN